MRGRLELHDNGAGHTRSSPMDVGRGGRLYALHFEHVAHLRFVDLDLGLTPSVLVAQGWYLFFAPQRLLEGLGGGFIASGVLGRVQSQCPLCL